MKERSERNAAFQTRVREQKGNTVGVLHVQMVEARRLGRGYGAQTFCCEAYMVGATSAPYNFYKTDTPLGRADPVWMEDCCFTYSSASRSDTGTNMPVRRVVLC